MNFQTKITQFIVTLIIFSSPLTFAEGKSKSRRNCEAIVAGVSDLKKHSIDFFILTPEEYAEGYRAMNFDSKNKKLGAIKLKKRLGEGYRAEVWLAEDGRVFKIARNAKSVAKLHMEFLVNQYLKEHIHQYQIPVDRIVAVGPGFSWLEKVQLQKKYLAENYIKENSDLNSKNLAALENVYKGGVQFAKDTRIGLDLKSANLWWDKEQGQWVLFDGGPRTTYLPFGFTLDRVDFTDYLKEWLEDEPPE